KCRLDLCRIWSECLRGWTNLGRKNCRCVAASSFTVRDFVANQKHRLSHRHNYEKELPSWINPALGMRRLEPPQGGGGSCSPRGEAKATERRSANPGIGIPTTTPTPQR